MAEISRWSNTQATAEVACPRCKQGAGKPCRTPMGRLTDMGPHNERSGLYMDTIGREEWDRRHSVKMVSGKTVLAKLLGGDNASNV